MVGRDRIVGVALVVLLLAAGGTSGVAAGAASADIEQSIGPSLGDGDTVRTTIEYRLPDRVEGLTVRLPVVATDAGRVTTLRGFRRVNASTFEWTGAARPRIELALTDDARRVLAGDGWALLIRPDVSTSYRYRGERPTVRTSFAVDGRGYVGGALAYLGPHRTETVATGGERTTFVVSAAAQPATVSGAARFLRLAPGRFDLGVRRDASTVFVLPERHTPSASGTRVVGVTVQSSLWVGPQAVRPRPTDATFAHEYVHTRLGIVGRGSARWLNEATAEYFGNAFALNADRIDYEGFRAELTADRFAPSRRAVTLSQSDTWAGTLADYEKGSLVLAALDAEIRRRTDGAKTLADVFVERPGPYEDYAAFRRAVVATTDRPSIENWLDRYVTTDALPTLPEDAGTFVYGPELDPDDDGADSGRERARGTNPFVAGRTGTEAATTTDAATPTPTVTQTPTATQTTAGRTDGGGTTAGEAGGFGVVGAVAGLGLAAFASALVARRSA